MSLKKLMLAPAAGVALRSAHQRLSECSRMRMAFCALSLMMQRVPTAAFAPENVRFPFCRRTRRIRMF